VEIDPVVVRLARRWMGFSRAGAVKLHLEDGRRFIERDRSRWDLILLDAYDGEDYPAHLGTREFFELASSRLTAMGVLVANLSPNGREMQRDLVATFNKALPGAVCRVTARDTNRVCFGGAPVRARPGALGERAFMDLARPHGGRSGLFWGDGGPSGLDLQGARILGDPPPTSSPRQVR
jgi:spermidine synthase